MLTIFHNPRCKKSREALKLLENEKVEFEVIEYLKEVPSEGELQAILNKLGIKPEQLLRKNEKVFKEEYKGKELSDDEWVKAMVEHPKLIERPIVINNDKAVIGRPPEEVLTVLN